MGVEIDATGVASEEDTHGSNRPVPGKYHVRIDHWDDTFEQTDKVVATFVVLAGTVPGQEGTEHREWFATSDAAMPRLRCVCIATGAVPFGRVMQVEAADMEGRELVIKLIDKEGTDGKIYTNITWDGMWSLGNPAVASVPRAEGGGADDTSWDI